MVLKLPIYHMGIAQDANQVIKIAILQKTCKGWLLSHCQQLSSNSPLPKKYRFIKATLSISGTHTLIKSMTSSLRSKKNILRVALSDLETQSALPLERLLISSTLGKTTPEQETPITLWMTKKETANHAISCAQQALTLPESLSCSPADIFFFSQQTLSSLPLYFFVYQGCSETTCLFVHNGIVLLSRSFGNAQAEQGEDILLTLEFIKQNYPKISLSAIHTQHITTTMKRNLEQKTSLPILTCPHQTFGLSEVEWKQYGDAILAAYHGASKNPILFPYDITLHSKETQKYWWKRTLCFIGFLALCSTCFTWLCSTIHIHKLANQVRSNCLLISKNDLPRSLHSIERFLTNMAAEPQTEYPYLPTIPTNQHIIHLLSKLAKPTPSIKILYYRYALTSFPTEHTPQAPYQAQIIIQGTGNAEEIEAFTNALSHHLSLSSKAITTSSFECTYTITPRKDA